MPPTKPNDLKNANKMVISEHLKGKTIVIFVYSPMCGYCAAMRDEWNDAAQKMSKKGIVVVEMDVRNTDDVSLPLPYIAGKDMTGVPHLLGIQGKTILTHSGERTSPGIQKWAQDLSRTKPTKQT